MNSFKYIQWIFTFTLLLLSYRSFCQSKTNERAKWFVDARFGMFIHWGVYSGAEGYWKGEKHRDDNNYAEWIFYRNRIGKEEYLTLIERFNWEKIDPEQWVILAKNAGMKYVTITAKHHDGFALWESEVSGYDVAEYTNPKRDIIKELADACRKYGLKLGLYYSHWVDWEHKYGWDHTKEIYPITAAQYNQYWQEKVMPQMRELLTNYGPVGLIWFDMWVNHSETIVTKKQLLQLKGLIRELQPDCLVNSRLGLSVEEDPDIDFRTLGDNQLGSYMLDYPWQSPATVAHSWGFHAGDTDWKSTTALLQSLVSNVSLNGNYMLNIGPKANGEVPYEISQRMLEMGAWLDVNGESVYGCGGYDLNKDLHDWGKFTYKEEDGKYKLFLQVFRWPDNGKLTLTGVSTKPTLIYSLKDKSKTPLDFEFNQLITTVDIPELQPDPYISVIVAEYDSKPLTTNGLVAKTVDGGYNLNFNNLLSESGEKTNIKKNRRGTVPDHLEITDTYQAVWKIYVEKPQTVTVDASYSFQGLQAGGTITVQAAGKSIEKEVNPTGNTIGEPNKGWIISNFISDRVGTITFPEAGIYEINMELSAGSENPVQFQWLWLIEE